MAEILSIISFISFGISGTCFILAIFFWFKFKIPSVVGDLSGKTARKSIAKMRESNEKSGKKSYQSSSVNVNRGKVTESMPDTRPETGILEENKGKIVDRQGTELLDEDETTGLLIEEEGTEPLQQMEKQFVKRTGGKELVMLEEIMLVHTDEVLDLEM